MWFWTYWDKTFVFSLNFILILLALSYLLRVIGIERISFLKVGSMKAWFIFYDKCHWQWFFIFLLFQGYCYPDEHYLPTFFHVSLSNFVIIFGKATCNCCNSVFTNPLCHLRFQMVDPGGIANWSVTHVDWSERKWHPKAYRAKDVSFELIRSISVCHSNLSLIFPSVLSLIFVLADSFVWIAVDWS